MKNLFCILFLFLSACAGGGSGTSAAPTAGEIVETPAILPDNTPHTYTIVFYVDSGPQYTGTLREQCAVGFPGHRDESAEFILQDPNTNGGVGCADAENVILTATNTGAGNMFVAVTVDGVYLTDIEMGLPGQILGAGQNFVFTRGY